MLSNTDRAGVETKIENWNSEMLRALSSYPHFSDWCYVVVIIIKLYCDSYLSSFSIHTFYLSRLYTGRADNPSFFSNRISAGIVICTSSGFCMNVRGEKFRVIGPSRKQARSVVLAGWWWAVNFNIPWSMMCTDEEMELPVFCGSWDKPGWWEYTCGEESCMVVWRVWLAFVRCPVFFPFFLI